MFGGSQESMFGASGADSFFTKATAVMAVIFMLTSFSLALMSGRGRTAAPSQEIQPQSDVAPQQQTLPQTDTTTTAPAQGQ